MLRRHVNTNQFAITLKQVAKYLGINPRRIIKFQKWYNVLWVHIEGVGGRFVSYRKLEQWISACCGLINRCGTIKSLQNLWGMINAEYERYTQTGFARLETVWRQRYDYLTRKARKKSTDLFEVAV